MYKYKNTHVAYSLEQFLINLSIDGIDVYVYVNVKLH